MPSRTPASGAAARPSRTRTPLEIPLTFEQNNGQHSGAVKYAGRAPGYSVAMLDAAVALSLRTGGAPSSRITMRFGRGTTSPAPEARLEGRANYFVGRSEDWRTDIPMFGRVRYKDAFAGIDLVFYGREQQLEYDVVVSPGADPRAVAIAFDGVESLHTERDGGLELHAGGRELHYSRPVAYQLAGVERVPVDVSYRTTAHSIGFAVGPYDRTRPLVIDPVLRFSTYLGGNLHDFPSAVAVDAAGSTYVTGYTESTDFPVTAGAVQPANPTPEVDAFVTKFSPSGSIVYSTYLGGSVTPSGSANIERASGIAVDGFGSAYVTGYTTATDFPVTTGAFQRALRGEYDAFVTKLSLAGNRLLYSTYLGGTRQDAAAAIAVDMRGFAYVGGNTTSADFPATAGVVDPGNAAGDQTGFVVKLNQAGSGLVYGTYLTGSQQFVSGLAVDADGSVVGAGSILYAMQTTQGPTAPLGDWDAFVFRLGPSGTTMAARRLGGAGADFGYAVAIGGDGNVYIAGSTSSSQLDAFHQWGQLHAGGSDAFYMETSSLFHYVFDAGYLGGSADDTARAIFVDDAWKVTIVGSTRSTDFPVAHPIQPAIAGDVDAFVTQFSFDHIQSPSFSTYLGGTHMDSAFGATVDGTGAVTLVGETDSTDFPVAHAAQPANRSANTSSGVYVDGFVTRMTEVEPGSVGSQDIVVHPATVASLHGNWFAVDDTTAASGLRLHNPDAGAAKVTTPLANPSDYFEFTVSVQPGSPYRMWLRGKAQADSVYNDSVWVQFSNTSNGSYEEAEFEELYRIGTANALPVTIEDCQNCLVRGWGWQDGGWGLNQLGPIFYFDSAEATVRVQRREDGISIDQIVLVPAYEGSPSPYATAAPGYQKDDTTILPVASPAGIDRDIVLYPAVDAPELHGNWTIAADTTAAGHARIWNPDKGGAKLSAPLASPADYVDLRFRAFAGVGYRIWIRGKAENNYWGNDSVFVQFSQAADGNGMPVWALNSTSATTINLEDCSGCGLSGWGWQDNGWGANVAGPLVYFDSDGEHTIRIQTREDGLSMDQIVLSPVKYIQQAPGALKNDSTMVPR